ncbi:MAG: GyrI-like domain-containing protein [Christensenellaceae bacterium]
MARVSAVTIVQKAEEHTLHMRKTIHFETEFAGFAQLAFQEAAAHIEALGLLPAGGPYVCFRNMDLGQLDVEAGWPVAQQADGKGDVCAGVLKAGKVATAIDLGPYERSDPTLTDVMTWIEKEGYAMSGPIYYRYLNDTERPESEFLTCMEVPVE